MDTIITINDLSFCYGRTEAVLSGISLQVSKGESWAIIGNNGSGKTTLIKCFAGLIPIKSGTVLIGGKGSQEYRQRDLARILSYVPQANGRAVPPFRVIDYVMMGRFPYQKFLQIQSKEDRDIVLETLHLTDTVELANRFMNTLSGGELQRVYIAGAVAQRTSVILLDEPVTFLDPLHQELIYGALQKVRQQYGTTLITVTHDLNAALNRYSHIVALQKGTMQFAGTVEDFLRHCPHILQRIFSLDFEQVVCRSGMTLMLPEMVNS